MSTVEFFESLSDDIKQMEWLVVAAGGTNEDKKPSSHIEQAKDIRFAAEYRLHALEKELTKAKDLNLELTEALENAVLDTGNSPYGPIPEWARYKIPSWVYKARKALSKAQNKETDQ